MKKILLTAAMLCLTASLSLAAGLNLYWNSSIQCPASPTADNINQDWDCVTLPDANTGSFIIVGSFMPNLPIVGFTGIDCVIDGQTPGDVPAWWQMGNVGACREASILPGAPTGTLTAPCAGTASTRLWTTTASGGLTAFQTALYPPPLPLDPPAANRFRIKVAYSLAGPRANPLNVLVQYNAFNLTIDTNNSAVDVENGVEFACAGCEVGATMVFNQVYTVGAVAEDFITNQLTNRCITWQGGAGAGVCAATPARNSTWGQVKSLYR